MRTEHIDCNKIWKKVAVLLLDPINADSLGMFPDYAELVMECQSLKDENEALADRYLMAELENFEITSHYEQILAEEQAKVAHYESIYTNKLRLLHADDSSLLLSSRRPSSSTTPSPPAIPDDD